MSFFFGKKKQAHNPLPPATRDTHTPGGSSIPTVNGVKSKERGPSTAQTSTPGSSINNSVNSVGGNHTPSPDHGIDQRGGSEHDRSFGPRAVPNGASPPDRNPATLYPWSQRRLTFTSSQPNPFPRYGAAVNAVASKEGDLYLMGGLINSQTVKGDLWMIGAGDPNLPCYPIGTKFEGPGPRVGHASLLVGNAFIVFGGDTKINDQDKLDDTLYLLNTSSRQWSKSNPPGPRPAGRYGHTLNILGSKIYVFGGQVEGHFFNDLMAFDLNTLQNQSSVWEKLILNSNEDKASEVQTPPARTNHTIVSWNDRLYLFGGTDGNQWFNDVWSYDPRKNNWSQLDCIGYIPIPREGHSAALVNDVMYIFGGRTEEGTDLGDLAAFRITTRRWYTFQNMGQSPSPRSGHSMTSFGKQIFVLAGEPSSAPRDASELSLVYILDTNKIRYRNDQQTQQTPSSERVPGNRRPSADKGAALQIRGPSRDASNGPSDGPRRQFSDSRESMETGRSIGPGGMAPGVRGPDSGITNSTIQGSNSRLPRASMAQATSGPPPQQQAPPPKVNGVAPSLSGPRSRTPTRDNRGFGPPVDTGRGNTVETENVSPVVSPITKESSYTGPPFRTISPAANGRQTPNDQSIQQLPQQTPKLTNIRDEEKSQKNSEDSVRSQSRLAIQRPSLDETGASPASSGQQPDILRETTTDMQNQSPVKDTYLKDQTLLRQELAEKMKDYETLLKELEAVRSRNVWYASELALARKAGYQKNSSPGPALDQRATPSFGDEDKAFIEALINMRAQLAEVQGSMDSRAYAAAQNVAEIEQQRDIAVREAAYAKAKLAAHGSSQTGTPMSESMSREVSSEDRATELSRKLATALATQTELRATVTSMTAQIEAEKQAKELAEATADAAHKRATELDQLRNPGEVEALRMELHETGIKARDEAAQKSEALAKMQLLEVDNSDLTQRLETALEDTRQHSTMLVSLRDAVGASSDKAMLLERKLDEERAQKEAVDQKLLQLKAEFEERTAELESTTRKLRDAEELVDTHAKEATTHRGVVLAGLDKINNAQSRDSSTEAAEERIRLMRQQVEDAHLLVRKNQEDADGAAEKLRRAEERIAGLEAYQEQSSRESLAIHRKLQDAVRERQTLQIRHDEIQQRFESDQRDKNALVIQHNALKDLLGEKRSLAPGKSRNADSPGSHSDTPEQSRVRELEQQLDSSLKELEELKSSFESREQETDRAYRDKLEQLEMDYQSAVHYVKGTEKMLRRMKDELAKSEMQNAQLQKALDGSSRSQSRSVEPELATEWEEERQSLRREIEEMQESVKDSVSQLERQMEEIQSELYAAQEERDHYRQVHQQLAQSTQQARIEMDQLKNENSMLESRAIVAERKVTILLDQVETSVGNYRRQSQNMPGNGHHFRNISSTSTNTPSSQATATKSHSQNDSISDALFHPPIEHINTTSNPRNSQALDSLASELEDLRSQWQDTHRNYRLSKQFDYDRSPLSATDITNEGMSDSLANWRRRLDAEEARKKGNSTEGDVDSITGANEKSNGSSAAETSPPALNTSVGNPAVPRGGITFSDQTQGKMPGALSTDEEDLREGRNTTAR